MKFKFLALLLIPLSIFLISSTLIPESKVIENIVSTEMLDIIKEGFQFDELLNASFVKEGGEEFLFVRGLTNGVITTTTKNVSEGWCTCDHNVPKYRGYWFQPKPSIPKICAPCFLTDDEPKEDEGDPNG